MTESAPSDIGGGATANRSRWLAASDDGVLRVFVTVGAALAGLLAWAAPPDRLLLFLLGIGLGLSLCHAAFGFTGGWRRAIEETRTVGLRA